MVICLGRGADLHTAQLMPLPLTVSCFSKIQIDFTFLVPANLGSPGQRAVKRVCLCVCVHIRIQVGRLLDNPVPSASSEKPNSISRRLDLTKHDSCSLKDLSRLDFQTFFECRAGIPLPHGVTKNRTTGQWSVWVKKISQLSCPFNVYVILRFRCA